MAQATQWVAKAWRVTWEGTHPLATLEEGIKWPSKACPRCVVPQTSWTKATSYREAAYLDTQSALQSAGRREALPGAASPAPALLGSWVPLPTPENSHWETCVWRFLFNFKEAQNCVQEQEKNFFIYIVTVSSFILTVFCRKIQYFLINEKW